MKRTALLGLTLIASTTLHAEPVTGVLHAGKPHSSLIWVSTETGDLAVYHFPTQSPVGKAIFAQCMPDMGCEVGQATLKQGNRAIPLGIENDISNLEEIVDAKKVRLARANALSETNTETRFGILQINPRTKTLLWHNKATTPTIQGRNGLMIVGHYHAEKGDVLVVENQGGQACPSQYRVVFVNQKGLTASPEFGTCSEYFSVDQLHPDGADIRVADTSGPRPKAVIYRFANGVLTQNGKRLH